MISIRTFKPDDTVAIVNLFTQAVHAINKRDYTSEQLAIWAPEDCDVQKWQDKLAKNITFVAEKDGKIVGFADITRAGYLDHLYISKDHQGGLVSMRLLKAIEQAAKSLGIKTITTYCSITAKRPAEFMGFVAIKQQTVTRDDVEFVNYIMEKKL